MVSNQKKTKNKRPYEKPRLRTIELVADQVLGVGCKTYLGGLVSNVGDVYCGYPSNPCVADGS